MLALGQHLHLHHLRGARLCHFEATAEWSAMLAVASSYVAFIYLTHTFSNSIETFLFAALVYLVVKELHAAQQRKSSQINAAQTGGGALIGLVCCLGVFNRPTFVVYSLVPVIYWLFAPLLQLVSSGEQPQWKPLLVNVAYRTVELTKWALPAAMTLVLVDTAYYYDIVQSGGVHELVELILSRRLVVTPYNFIAYNTNAHNLAQHGEHAFYQHALVNCTLLFGPAYLVLFAAALVWLLASKAARLGLTQRRDPSFVFLRFLSAALLVPLALLSLVSHKEPRFLLPLLVPVCLLTSGVMSCAWFGTGRRRLFEVRTSIQSYLLNICNTYLSG